MEILCFCILEEDEELIEQFVQDDRIKIIDNYACCKKINEESIFKDYGIHFYNACFPFFESRIRGNTISYCDLDMQFYDLVELCNYYSDIYDEDINAWLNKMCEILTECVNWFLNNRIECKRELKEILYEMVRLSKVV